MKSFYTILCAVFLELAAMSKSIQRIRVHAACPCPCCMFISFISTLHVHDHTVCPCPCCSLMSMLHVQVHAACGCPRCMYMPVLHLEVHAACLCPSCMSMLHVHSACPSKLHAHVHVEFSVLPAFYRNFLKRKLEFLPKI